MSSTVTRGDYQAALNFLLGRIDYERAASIPYRRHEFRLDRMRNLLARLDNPQGALKIVHVAGTKGKGSTAAMISSVLAAAGYRCGLFSSPHLERVEERLAIDGQPCSEERLVALVDRLRGPVAHLDRTLDAGPTYFEITTAMALLHFAEAHVDATVLEVGLGGRLDSTNVCQPEVAVITNISFDHMKQLGNTLASIAREKAGIIKPGVPVVSGVTPDEPRRVIEETARRRGSPLIALDQHFTASYEPPRNLDVEPGFGRLAFEYRHGDDAHGYEAVELGLPGRHQAANAAVALAALAQLRRKEWCIPEAAIRQGLRQVRWPARVEVVSRAPAVVLDAAHNEASVASLVATLDESFAARRRILVFATTQEKEVRAMLATLLPHFDEVVLTRYQNNPRGVPVEELAALAGELSDRKPHVHPEVGEAWRKARSLAAADDLICVTGSFFLAAEIRQHLSANFDSARGQ